MGVTECDNMLMLLGISNKLSDKVRLARLLFLPSHFNLSLFFYPTLSLSLHHSFSVDMVSFMVIFTSLL